jgi:flavodoxin
MLGEYMKVLIVCDSNFGNTMLIAKEIAKNIDSDVTVKSVKDFKLNDLNGVELLIVGSPIVGWRPTEATVSMLDSFKGKLKEGIKFSTFDTRVKLFVHGDAKEKIASSLRAMGGKQVFEPQAFFVKGKEGPLYPGEIEKAAAWANLIKSKLK